MLCLLYWCNVPKIKVTTFHEEITSVATSAVQEGVLEEMMGKVSAMWAKTEFEVSYVTGLHMFFSILSSGGISGNSHFNRHAPACYFLQVNSSTDVPKKVESLR